MKFILSAIFYILLAASSAFATVSSTNYKDVYNADGSTTVWGYDFPIILSTDIQVYTIDNIGTQTQQTTNFSINTTTHQVTYPVVGSAVASGWQVVLLRSVPLTQSTSLKNQYRLPLDVLETSFDKLTMMVQQNQLQSLNSNVPITFPVAITGDLLGWSSTGVLTNISNPSLTAQWTLNSGNISYNTGNVSTTNNLTVGGNIGIGSLSPGQKLDVQGTARAITFSGAGTSLTGTAASLTAGNVTTNANLTGPITSVGNATSIASQTGTGTIFVMQGGNPNFTGNVGIGSATPGQKLDVQGTARFISITGQSGHGMLGAWSTGGSSCGGIGSSGCTYNTIYGPITTDGIVEGYVGDSGTFSNLAVSCITDSSATPSTVRTRNILASDSLGTSHGDFGCTTHVRKGDYFDVTASSDGTINEGSVYFIPWGS